MNNDDNRPPLCLYYGLSDENLIIAALCIIYSYEYMQECASKCSHTLTKLQKACLSSYALTKTEKTREPFVHSS